MDRSKTSNGRNRMKEQKETRQKNAERREEIGSKTTRRRRTTITMIRREGGRIGVCRVRHQSIFDAFGGQVGATQPTKKSTRSLSLSFICLFLSHRQSRKKRKMRMRRRRRRRRTVTERTRDSVEHLCRSSKTGMAATAAAA